jgi:hypothetical protein
VGNMHRFNISKCCRHWTLGCRSSQWEHAPPGVAYAYVNAIGQTQVEYNRSKPTYNQQHLFVRPWGGGGLNRGLSP